MRITIRAAVLGALATLAIAAPASAHVTAQPAEHPAGGYTVVTLRVPNERPEATNLLEVQIPEGINSVSVKPVPGWTSKVTMQQLDEPIDAGHGEQITERPESITWTGGTIEAGQFQEFPVSVRMPEEGQLEDLLFFPAIQTYEGGEVVNWTELPETADSDAELERPAPAVTLVAGGDAHGGAAADADTDEGDSGSGSADESSSDSEERDVVAYALAIAALVIALIALVLSLRRGGARDAAVGGRPRGDA